MKLRYFHGTCFFEAEGDLPERLINLLNKKGVEFWNLTKTAQNKITFCVRLKDKSEVIYTAQGIGFTISLREERGFPRLIKKYRRRWGLLTGGIGFLIFLYMLCGCVWSIEVTGNSKIPDSEIIAALKEAGLYEGCPKARLNLRNIRQKMRLELNGVSYVELNIEGSKATVCVIDAKESEEKEKIPCNLIAACDGIITRVEITCGEPAVSVGDTVKKGQLLASGIQNSRVQGYFLLPAEGRVYAAHTAFLEAYVPFEQTYYRRTGAESKKYRLKLFNFYIKLYRTTGNKYEVYDKIYKYDEARFMNTPLPVGLETVTEYETEMITERLTREQAENAARLELDGLCRENFSEASVSENEIRTEFSKNGCKIKGYYTVTENIAVKQIIETN